MGTQFFEIEIPGLPPSVNSLYATFRGRRIKSKEGRLWDALSIPIIKRSLRDELASGYFKNKKHFSIGLNLYFYRPTWKCKTATRKNKFIKRDLTNLFKAPEDSLFTVLEPFELDDSQVIDMTGKKIMGKKEHTMIRMWFYEGEEDGRAAK